MNIHAKEKKKIKKRRDILLKVCPDIKDKKGIEIGPLCYPTLTKAESDIKYLDHLSTEELNNAFALDYQEPISEVDIVTRGRSLKEVLAGQKFNYFIANHVIEHIPDIIGWLRDIHNLLEPGGLVFLAVPDKKFTFDSDRMETSCGHLIVDFEDGGQIDSAEHHLDALIYHDQKPEVYWNEIRKSRFEFVHHHHVFTHATFIDKIIKPLIRLRYLKFSVVACETASALYNEFVIILKKEQNFDEVRVLGEKPELQSRPASTITPDGHLHDFSKELQDIQNAGLFQKEWYLENYPQVVQTGLDPLKHYYFSGYKTGFNPSPDFDSRWYLEQNPDVAAAGYNPLWHYAVCGKGEGRKPRP